MKVNMEGKKITSDNWKQGLLKFMINRAVDRKHHYAEKYFWTQIPEEEVTAQLWYYWTLNSRGPD